MELTPRDAEILRLLRRHRFLRSNHIAALLGDSRQQLLRRLQKLYHHGYVERPPCQLDYFHRGGSLAMVYGLGNRGAAFLLRTENSTPIRLDWNARNRSATRLFLDHALMISEILVALETECRVRGDVRLRHAEELEHSAQGYAARWSITAHGAEHITVIPDAVFALERTQADGSTDSVLYCLEADRGTMPVQSANQHRTSIARKLTAYETSWRTNIFRQRFNASRVQVLTVTTSAARLDSITACAGNRVSAAGLFHFAAFTEILVSSAQFLDSLLMRHVHSLPQSDLSFSRRTAT
jgi:DNA-binding Lrp family transcriptional regulator